MAALELRQGTVFAGDYRVLEPLAHGGMGAVYVAEQVSTGRRRALKVMHPILVADDAARSRFIQEARVGGLIDSDHVVEVIAAGVDEASMMPWLCMELLEGETLQDRISRLGGLPPEELAEVAVQLRHALARAHHKGLVHRDLKPENIFLENPRRTGVLFTVKILDFGIAKLVQQAKGRQASGTQALGSPLWMAPEQANAQPVSPATDVWAIGLIAFAALTCRIYWRTASTDGDLHLTKLLVEILVDPMSTASERAEELAAAVIPGAGFDRWFARCIAREPASRHPEAGACLDALIEVLSADDVVTRNDVAPADLARASTTPAVIDSLAKTATHEESFEPIVHGVVTKTDEPQTPRKKGSMGMGQIAALLGGSVLVALLAIFGGVVGIGLFTGEDSAPTSQVAPATTITETPEPNEPPDGPPTVPTRPEFTLPTGDPIPPRPADRRLLNDPSTDPSPELELRGREDRGNTPPIATTSAGRVLYSRVVQECWQAELERTHHGPTRMRFELVLGPGGRYLENIVVPRAWHGTPFAGCVVGRIRHARFDEVPSAAIVLNLPASP